MISLFYKPGSGHCKENVGVYESSAAFRTRPQGAPRSREALEASPVPLPSLVGVSH